MDIHICGACDLQYSTIEEFIHHKSTACSSRTVVNPEAANNDTGTSGRTLPGIPESYQRRLNVKPQYSSLNDSSVERLGESDLATVDCEVTCTSLLPQKIVKRKYRKKCAENTLKTTQQKRGSVRTKIGQYVKQFKCTFDGCKFVTAHRKDLKRHHLTHTGEKPFACQFCPKQFARNDKRKLHERKHTNEKPFKCSMPACNYMCADGGSLKKHMRIHFDERPHQCQLCPYASRTASQLVVHLRRHTGDVPFHCQQCEAKFTTNTDLKRHMLIHTGEKPFSCDECNYKSRLKCNLKSHIASNHRGKHKYQCETCPFKCRTKRQLRGHIADNHMNSKLKSIEWSFTTSKTDALKQQRRKRRREPPLKCRFCQYSSKLTRIMISHMKKHHPDKDSQIETENLSVKSSAQSPRKKRQMDMKKRALKVMVPIDGKQPFKCDDCDASFVREDSFRSHQRQHQHIMQSDSGNPLQSAQDSKNTLPKDTQSTSDVHAGIKVTVTPLLQNQENQRVFVPAVSDKKVLLVNETCSNECANKNDIDGDPIIREVILPRETTEARPHQGVQVIEIVQGNTLVSAVNTSRSSSDDSLMNAISSSARFKNPGLAQAGDQSRPSQSISQNLSEAQQRNQDVSCISAADDSIQLDQNTSLAVQSSGCGDQGQMNVQPKQQSAVVQSQTLGYGTSNLPVVFASLMPASQTPAALPSSASCGQTIVVNNLAPPLLSPCTEGNPANVTQASDGNAPSKVSAIIGGMTGGVQFVYANPIPQPVAAASLLQQVAATQQPQQRQHQQLNLKRNEQSDSPSRPQLPALVTYVTTSGLPPSSAPLSLPFVPTVNQSQRGLELHSVPTGSFILNGRAISRGPPATDKMSSTNVATHSQSFRAHDTDRSTTNVKRS